MKKSTKAILLWIGIFPSITCFTSCKEKDKDKDPNGEIRDIDGNVYQSVVIGTQEWMVENLKTTKYNDGAAISTGQNATEWNSLGSSSTGAYFIYPHASIEGISSDNESLKTFGGLYNWYAVKSGKLCPKGWRVASDLDWTNLTQFVGGEVSAGGKLKSTKSTPNPHPRWQVPNIDATNEHGFSALPNGTRDMDGIVVNTIQTRGNWWTSTENEAFASYARVIGNNFPSISRVSEDKRTGLCVRCIRE